VAYDLDPWAETWTEVLTGGPEQMGQHRDRTLFLCWPPYDTPMGLGHLVAHAGNWFIYVGEGSGGCTGDDAFHEYLREHFECVERVEIPQWDGIYDDLSIWARRDLPQNASGHFLGG